MSDINEGIRALSDSEIGAVAGAGATSCSPRVENLQAISQILGCRPCSPVVRCLENLVNSQLRTKYY